MRVPRLTVRRVFRSGLPKGSGRDDAHWLASRLRFQDDGTIPPRRTTIPSGITLVGMRSRTVTSNASNPNSPPLGGAGPSLMRLSRLVRRPKITIEAMVGELPKKESAGGHDHGGGGMGGMGGMDF